MADNELKMGVLKGKFLVTGFQPITSKEGKKYHLVHVLLTSGKTVGLYTEIKSEIIEMYQTMKEAVLTISIKEQRGFANMEVVEINQ